TTSVTSSIGAKTKKGFGSSFQKLVVIYLLLSILSSSEVAIFLKNIVIILGNKKRSKVNSLKDVSD
ncbi:hypothetical protein, partial [Enterococcus faecium]